MFAARDGEIYRVTRVVGGRPGMIRNVLERTLRHKVTKRNVNTIEMFVKHQALST